MRKQRVLVLFLGLLMGCAGVWAKGNIIEIAAEDGLPSMSVYYPTEHCPDGGFPILYLFHGIRGNHMAWVRNGRVREVVDSLIDADAIEPIIIVMPYCFTRTREDQTNHIFTRYDDLVKRRFEQQFPALMARVEATFPIAQDYSKRFIAGLSSGARQALNLADTARCSVVGLLSPVLARSEYPTPKPQIPIYWIATGNGDAFRAETKHFARYLDEQGMPYQLEYVEGKHNWQVWAPVLPEFLKDLVGKAQ